MVPLTGHDAPAMPTGLPSAAAAADLAKQVPTICLAPPEAAEQLSHGGPGTGWKRDGSSAGSGLWFTGGVMRPFCLCWWSDIGTEC
jgi:hypothetical protein